MILASSSPRRAEILRDIGLRFRVVVPDVDERRLAGESPRRYVRRLALDKARQVAERYPREWVVAADTTVVVGDTVFGKPRDPRQARRMLRDLSGRSHVVLSGVAVARLSARIRRAAVSRTRVFFRKLTRVEIDRYVRTGEPNDKAGAYGIQRKGALLVQRIEGSYTNVVGFPLETFLSLWQSVHGPRLF
ncbi:MAG TPA: nucleoside triphosphate pyrophosphatase [Vicinamibacteria bacterium]|nr:nucleoside triphosphate pyrophosphatase [Vicinamibacteria bacterium]